MCRRPSASGTGYASPLVESEHALDGLFRDRGAGAQVEHDFVRKRLRDEPRLRPELYCHPDVLAGGGDVAELERKLRETKTRGCSAAIRVCFGQGLPRQLDPGRDVVPPEHRERDGRVAAVPSCGKLGHEPFEDAACIRRLAQSHKLLRELEAPPTARLESVRGRRGDGEL
jgi:hypothetical protein